MRVAYSLTIKLVTSHHKIKRPRFTNIFNTKNVTGVWRATGNPDDDGYLAAPEYQANINEQTDPAAYRDLYASKVDNPNNYARPRTIRLGARLDF